ncbi:MAG TPA: hypothetical protein VGX48_14145 [Pyrinomonadaceae bacterium]|jgi:hypothetical protein|nr:hypothetical protein [Pyrinomonadaceae bacterium]
MSFDAERLYELLPAVYRVRDAERGEPLRALLSVIAGQVAVIEEDLEQLYDDQFIETCSEWAVPYIGDLVGVSGLFARDDSPWSNRAQVANALRYRRRKGTATVLEQLARDVTNWPARAVEFFELLATTQYMNHLRPHNLAAPDLRRWEPLERINSAFDTVAHTAEVRHVTGRRGRYNIPSVGLFLWRLRSYTLTAAPAYKVDERRFLFNPLGLDTPLFNNDETEDEITHLAEPVNVPEPISRRALDRYKNIYYGKSIVLFVDGNEIAAGEVVVCDLSDDGADWANAAKAEDKHAVDPVTGRLRLPDGVYTDPEVRVTFNYGFSAETGGGEYGRDTTFQDDLAPVVLVPTDEATIQDALNTLTEGGAVEIEGNDYRVETPAFEIAAGERIEVRAAEERRPVLVPSGAVSFFGGEGSELTLNGLVMSGGSLHVPADLAGEPNGLRLLRIRHCTLLPGESKTIGTVAGQPAGPRVVVEAANVVVEIERSIVGAVRAVEGAKVRITDSIVDAGGETESAYESPLVSEQGASLDISNSTVVGRVRTETLEASNTIFLASPNAPGVAPVHAERLQEGCVRFSYVPPGSRVPRRYHCQPVKGAGPAQLARVRPVFTSLRYGDAAYCQLDVRCAQEIREGADDDSEMGAFHHLYQPQREANLRARLDEYLRFGLEAGIFYAS